MNNERKYWSGEFINKLEENQIFVFGSNPQARHWAGAAKSAQKFGAKASRKSTGEIGIARGISGQSYALITKSLEAGFTEESTGITYEKEGFASLSPEMISDNIRELYDYAFDNPDKDFLIIYKYETWPNSNKAKKSLNGYDANEMIAMFVDNQNVPDNIIFHESYKVALEKRLSMTNAAKAKHENMGKLQKAYTEAKKNGEVKKVVVNYSSVEDVYKKALNAKNLQFTFFFTANDVFSQWHPSKFVHKDYTFFSAEQFMMLSKAKLFKDEVVAQKIMNLNNTKIAQDFLSGKLSKQDVLSNKKPPQEYVDDAFKNGLFYGNKKPEEINNMFQVWSALQSKTKALGKQVSNFNEPVWKQKREGIIFAGSNLKYSQNPDMKELLMQTKGTVLVEASPYDDLSTN